MEKDTYLNDIQTTAKALYQLSIDMDYADYSESIQNDLSDIESALCFIKAFSDNPLSVDYFRTFARCLDLITENTIINNNIFVGECE